LKIQYFVVIGIDLVIEQLLISPAGSFLGRCGQEDFALGIWECDGSLIATLGHTVAILADASLGLDHEISDLGILGDGFDRLGHRGISDLASHILMIKFNDAFREFDLTRLSDLKRR
jgi:hypothetical protein